MSSMIEIWMKHHLGSDGYPLLQIYNVQVVLQGMTNNIKFAFSVGDTTLVLHNFSIEQDKETW
jgi:hypothetical protein